MASWRKVISLVANAPKVLRPTTASSARLISTQQQQKFHQDEASDRSGLLVALALASATGVALKIKSGDEGVLAESEEFAHENRVRMFMGLDKIFNYFASFQVTNKSGELRIFWTKKVNILTKYFDTIILRAEKHDDVSDGLLRCHYSRLQLGSR